jgi:hypothetical protein
VTKRHKIWTFIVERPVPHGSTDPRGHKSPGTHGTMVGALGPTPVLRAPTTVAGGRVLLGTLLSPDSYWWLGPLVLWLAPSDRPPV